MSRRVRTDRSSLTLITGGSRGIGHCLVESFLQEGDVLNIARGPATAEGEHRLHNLTLDLQDVEQIEPSLGAWFENHASYEVTTLIHNAAILNLGWLDEASPGEVAQAFRVNVHAPLAITSTIHCAGRFCPRRARVVYVVSSLGRPLAELSFAGLGLYSTTKAALSRLALIQSREFELTAPNVEVLRIHPGIVDTEIQRELRQDAGLDPAFAEKTAALPDYQDGEWNGRAPKDNMRTISASLAADFILWAVKSPTVGSHEYDFYHAEEFHGAHARA
jgi:NAD(P)-dependent dehydrogenase (short-subunit alcohol dehydrogenase family)